MHHSYYQPVQRQFFFLQSYARAFVQWHYYQSNLIFKPFLLQFFIHNENWPGLMKSYVKSTILVTSRMTIICKKPLCTWSMCDNAYVQFAFC